MAVINEDTVDSGTILLKRVHNDMRMLVEWMEPDPKSVAVHGDHAEIYYPKMQTVGSEVTWVYRALVDQFLLIGFGTSGKELLAAYQIKYLGTENIGGANAAHLELIPKSKEVLKQLKKLDLWVHESAAYPIQQKITQPAGDCMQFFTYSGVDLNTPHSDASLKLKAP